MQSNLKSIGKVVYYCFLFIGFCLCTSLVSSSILNFHNEIKMLIIGNYAIFSFSILTMSICYDSMNPFHNSNTIFSSFGPMIIYSAILLFHAVGLILNEDKFVFAFFLFYAIYLISFYSIVINNKIRNTENHSESISRLLELTETQKNELLSIFSKYIERLPEKEQINIMRYLKEIN